MHSSADGGAATLDRPADTPTTTRDDDRDLLAGVPPSRVDLLVAGLIAVAVILVAVIWRSPVIPTDPWHYVQRAITFPDRVWVPLGYTRYGIIIPNILPAKLFGNAQASYYFWPLISAGTLAAVVYLMGRRWWGPVAGAVAVVVLFTNSLVFQNLTRQYPDIMAMTLIFAGAFCALMARDREFRGRVAVSWVLASGFMLGWSFEVRETALFGWPLVIAILWRRGALVRVLAIAAIPVLGWAAARHRHRRRRLRRLADQAPHFPGVRRTPAGARLRGGDRVERADPLVLPRRLSPWRGHAPRRRVDAGFRGSGHRRRSRAELAVAADVTVLDLLAGPEPLGWRRTLPRPSLR